MKKNFTAYAAYGLSDKVHADCIHVMQYQRKIFIQYITMNTTFRALALTTFIALPAVGMAAGNTDSDTASANAQIVAPLQIEVQAGQNLSFGTVVSGPAAGTVTIATNGDRTPGGGVAILASGPGARVGFNVQGEVGYTYDITIPDSPVALSSGGNSMNVSDFTVRSTAAGDGATSATLVPFFGMGFDTLFVGATLNVDANQPSGLYTNTFNVQVSYQ